MVLNRNHFVWVIAVAGALAMTACNKTVQSKEAVQQGVMEYLQNRAGLDVKNMDITVASVQFRDKEAEANVTIAAKGAKDHANSMQLKYVLEQKDGKWVVKGKSGMGEHSAQPGGAMPGGSAMPGGAMPPTHPPAGGGAAMPPNHPPAPGAKQ